MEEGQARGRLMDPRNTVGLWSEDGMDIDGRTSEMNDEESEARANYFFLLPR